MNTEESGQHFNKNVDLIKQLMNAPFFCNIAPEAIDKITQFAEVITYAPGSIIINEGEQNDSLYILLEGTASVIVAGEQVAELNNCGDLIGEMSLVSAMPTSATIVSSTSTRLLKIAQDSLVRISQDDNLGNIKSTIYQLFAIVLAERLTQTNKKAKQFEVANRKLEKVQLELQETNKYLEIKVEERTADLKRKTEELEQKNLTLLASKAQVEELTSSKKHAFSMLENLYSNYLKPLYGSLENLQTNSSGEVRRHIVDSMQKVDNALQVLKPLTTLYFSEQALKNKRILVAETQKKQQLMAKLALGGAGVEFDIVDNVALGKSYLEKQKYDLILTDKHHLDLMQIAHELKQPAQLVVITSEPTADLVRELKKHPYVFNIISRNEENRSFTIKNISTTAMKLINYDIFGLEKYLTWGIEVQERAITSSKIRENLIAEMENYLSNLGVQSSVVQRAAAVAEELLMNAIYDAPVDNKGVSLYNHLPRNTPVWLKKNENGIFKFACDGITTAISVEDPFGNLKLDTILDYLTSCYDGCAGSLNTNKGGAGRGIHQVVESSDLVVFNVHKRVRTEIIAFFNLDRKAAPITGCSFHFFFQS